MKKVFPAVQNGATVAQLTLVDGEGNPIAAANVTAMTLTFWNLELGEDAIINGRDGQDVLNTNDCTYGATDGLFTWAVQAADNVCEVVGKVPGETELHAFRLDVAHTQVGSPFPEEYGIRVVVTEAVVEAQP